tara:strand:- start:74 stop:331 length:258 start_codon:yes stop_codon:yes gene_type:complete
MDYTITLSDAQVKSLEYNVYDPKDWIQNAAEAQAIRGSQEIISILTAHCNANNIQLAVGEDAQIAQAYSLNIVKTSKEVSDAAAK